MDPFIVNVANLSKTLNLLLTIDAEFNIMFIISGYVAPLEFCESISACLIKSY